MRRGEWKGKLKTLDIVSNSAGAGAKETRGGGKNGGNFYEFSVDNTAFFEWIARYSGRAVIYQAINHSPLKSRVEGKLRLIINVTPL